MSSRKRDRSGTDHGAGTTTPKPESHWRSDAEALAARLTAKISETVWYEAQHERHQRTAESANQRLDALRDANYFVRLCVGGTDFEVPLRTLLRDEGSVFHSLLSDHFQLDVVEDGDAILIDRDPTSFRCILNYLRGYKRLCVPEAEMAIVAADIDFYQLPGMRALLGLETISPARRMRSGPGVNAEGSRLRVAYSVALVGDHHLLAGRHQVTYEVLSGEYLGIGVCSELCTATDQEFHKTLNCCVYYMTGVFYSNFPMQRKEEGLEKFNGGDLVSVILDMDERTIEYVVRGISTKLISCGGASRMRFAVVGKLSSGVRIVPNALNTLRPTFSGAATDFAPTSVVEWPATPRAP